MLLKANIIILSNVLQGKNGLQYVIVCQQEFSINSYITTPEKSNFVTTTNDFAKPHRHNNPQTIN